MGGRPKGLLASPETGEPILARLLRLGREQGFELVIVGDASAYSALRSDARCIADEPSGIGPLGGLAALLRHAGGRPAIALSCDLPRLSAEVLARLAEHPSAAPVIATRRSADALWEPLVARYQSQRVLPVIEAQARMQKHSLQSLLAELEVEQLPLGEADRETLADWDSPDDLEHDPR
jgi:molybdopterin-guanine dinucleotide biosynthesis protein A